jgi:hypothetical protein
MDKLVYKHTEECMCDGLRSLSRSLTTGSFLTGYVCLTSSTIRPYSMFNHHLNLCQGWQYRQCSAVHVVVTHAPMFPQAPQYQAWCTGEPFNTNSSNYNNIDNAPFWSNPKCIQLYKAHVKTVLTR